VAPPAQSYNVGVASADVDLITRLLLNGEGAVSSPTPGSSSGARGTRATAPPHTVAIHPVRNLGDLDEVISFGIFDVDKDAISEIRGDERLRGDRGDLALRDARGGHRALSQPSGNGNVERADSPLQPTVG